MWQHTLYLQQLAELPKTRFTNSIESQTWFSSSSGAIWIPTMFYRSREVCFAVVRKWWDEYLGLKIETPMPQRWFAEGHVLRSRDINSKVSRKLAQTNELRSCAADETRRGQGARTWPSPWQGARLGEPDARPFPRPVVRPPVGDAQEHLGLGHATRVIVRKSGKPGSENLLQLF